jgi:glycerol-3-phosphate dehydrogenase subunit B
MVSGDLRDPGDVLIAGFSGLKDFYPAYMAHNISTVRVKGIRLPHFRGRVLDVDDGAGSSGLNSLTLAGKFENPTFLKMIADALYRTVRDGEKIAMPAVLGLLKFREVHKKIEELVGTKVFETPTLPPSVGGYRLFKALEKRLRTLGVRMLLGYEVSSPRVEGKRVREITIGMGKSEKKIEGKAFVLATGGLVGSGISSTRSTLTGPLFDLPVSFPKNRSDWFKKFFFDPSGHPINKAGIDVDDELRPTEDGKKAIFENLFVTGAELAGFDAIREKSGGGVAIASGYKAGLLSSGY